MSLGFVNTENFQEAANYFRKHKRFPDGDKGSYEYIDYWNEEHKKIKDGAWAGGQRITGEHYLYLNYCPIVLKQQRDGDEAVHKMRGKHERKSGAPREDFPAFWDEDYRFFRTVEIAKWGCTDEELDNEPIDLGLIRTDRNLNGGLHYLWLKPRGVGASYKGGVRPLYNQFFGDKKNSTFILADSKEYLIKDGILTKYLNYVSWINEHGGGLARNMLKQDMSTLTWISGYEKEVDGRKVIGGKQTQVIGITVDGDPDKARGKRGDMVWEEFGNFRKVSDAWSDAMNSVDEDGIVWAQMIGYGTGNLKQENFSSLEKMFYDPATYGLIQIKNQWDELLLGTPCAAFTPAYRSIGHRDKWGNSDEVSGRKHFDAIREVKNKAKDPQEFPKHCAQKPYNPAEAMASIIGNIFPTADIKAHKTYLEQTGIYKQVRRTVDLLVDEETGRVTAKINTKIPYESFPYKGGEDRTGTVVIYRPPARDEFGFVHENMYRICVDPYRHDTETGESVGACYVLENVNNISAYKGDVIAATWIARPKTQDEFNENVFRLAEYYNCKIGMENDEPGDIIGFAKRHKKLAYLETQFELAYDAKLQTKNTGRLYGMHISSGKDDLRKMQGDKYIQEWLTRRVGTDLDTGKEILNLHRILDIGLLEELLRYVGVGNYDRISALRIGMFYEKELIYKGKKVKEKRVVTGGLMERFEQGKFYSDVI